MGLLAGVVLEKSRGSLADIIVLNAEKYASQVPELLKSADDFPALNTLIKQIDLDTGAEAEPLVTAQGLEHPNNLIADI